MEQDTNNNNFEFLIGGEVPKEIIQPTLDTNEELPVVKNARLGNNTIMDHFDNCRWNTGKQLRQVSSCCNRGKQEVLMYFCDLLKIESLQPLICERCSRFTRREES